MTLCLPHHAEYLGVKINAPDRQPFQNMIIFEINLDLKKYYGGTIFKNAKKKSKHFDNQVFILSLFTTFEYMDGYTCTYFELNLHIKAS